MSVIVPAHNEESVIARCLLALRTGSEAGEVEVIVVCNGCADDTAQRAAAADPAAVVICLDRASKADALNAGDDAATRFPRFYVDADVELGIDAVRATASILESGASLCAAPRVTFELGGRPAAIRRFYRVWQEIPYLRDDMVGSGVYALSEAGRARFERFPSITADDQFVMQQFAGSERRSVFDHTFVVHAPRTVGGLLNMRTRVYRGNAELEASGHAGRGSPKSAAPTLVGLAQRPGWWPALATYVSINLVAHIRARRASAGWERDLSARRPARGR